MQRADVVEYREWVEAGYSGLLVRTECPGGQCRHCDGDLS